jgi:hypothetical protein
VRKGVLIKKKKVIFNLSHTDVTPFTNLREHAGAAAAVKAAMVTTTNRAIAAPSAACLLEPRTRDTVFWLATVTERPRVYVPFANTTVRMIFYRTAPIRVARLLFAK